MDADINESAQLYMNLCSKILIGAIVHQAFIEQHTKVIYQIFQLEIHICKIIRRTELGKIKLFLLSPKIFPDQKRRKFSVHPAA